MAADNAVEVPVETAAGRLERGECLGRPARIRGQELVAHQPQVARHRGVTVPRGAQPSPPRPRVLAREDGVEPAGLLRLDTRELPLCRRRGLRVRGRRGGCHHRGRCRVPTHRRHVGLQPLVEHAPRVGEARVNQRAGDAVV